jgi:glucan phosphoethanolaminetransferase (alkaline phosphatase superfamily)
MASTIQDLRRAHAAHRPGRLWLVSALAKLGLLAVFLIIINPGTLERAELLISQGRLGTLAIFAGVWGLALAATLVAAFEARWWARSLWALVLAFSGAAAWAYYTVSGAELTVFDAVSFWDARHEAGNAMAQYGDVVTPAVVLCLAGFLVLALPARRMLPRRGLLWRVTPLIPAIPVMIISAIVFIKAGNGSQAMPKHFSQVSLGLLLAYKTAFQPSHVRGEPAFAQAAEGSVPKILMIVDESIRPDYIDAENAHGETPNFASVAGRFVNYGPAAAGGICSNYANAVMRMAASRADIGSGINANPTLFSYAKKAGYRTVYIDAQAHTLANTDLMQNFMTHGERAHIDAFYPLTDVVPHDADRKLAVIIERELEGHEKVFIYANKLGSHFPYDETYPASETIHHPTQTEAGDHTLASTSASYRNAVRWSVDGYFKAQFEDLDLYNTALIYTSDHGQYLKQKSFTHCVSDGAAPEMALVPLYAYADNPIEMAKLRAGAEKSRGRASHFQIAPTVIGWMGYAQDEVMAHYGESLTAGTPFAPAFTMGDIFGLFSPQARWQDIDLDRDYREEGQNIAAAGAQQ